MSPLWKTGVGKRKRQEREREPSSTSSSMCCYPTAGGANVLPQCLNCIIWKPSFEIVGHYGLVSLFPIFFSNYRNAMGQSFSPDFTSLSRPTDFIIQMPFCIKAQETRRNSISISFRVNIQLVFFQNLLQLNFYSPQIKTIWNWKLFWVGLLKCQENIQICHFLSEFKMKTAPVSQCILAKL